MSKLINNNTNNKPVKVLQKQQHLSDAYKYNCSS